MNATCDSQRRRGDVLQNGVSFFTGVVLVLRQSHCLMLQRNLLYTALIRARQRAVIIVSGGLENGQTAAPTRQRSSSAGQHAAHTCSDNHYPLQKLGSCSRIKVGDRARQEATGSLAATAGSPSGAFASKRLGVRTVTRMHRAFADPGHAGQQYLALRITADSYTRNGG